MFECVLCGILISSLFEADVTSEREQSVSKQLVIMFDPSFSPHGRWLSWWQEGWGRSAVISCCFLLLNSVVAEQVQQHIPANRSSLQTWWQPDSSSASQKKLILTCKKTCMYVTTPVDFGQSGMEGCHLESSSVTFCLWLKDGFSTMGLTLLWRWSENTTFLKILKDWSWHFVSTSTTVRLKVPKSPTNIHLMLQY